MEKRNGERHSRREREGDRAGKRWKNDREKIKRERQRERLVVK